LLINYAGPQRSFPHYSVADVLAGKVPPEALRDKMVLVGATAIGIYDMRVVPFGGDYPGVEVHANVIDNILHQQYLQRPGWAAAADVAAILLLALALGLLLRRLRPLPGLGLAVAALVLWTYASYFAFTQGYWLSEVYPGLSVVLSYLGVTVYRFMGEEREKRVVKEAFQTYVSAAVVDEMLRDPGKLKLGGDKQVLTVLFSDIRGFTPVSERLAPDLLVRLLNEYFTEMTDVIFRQEGLLDKYIGDAVMAVFGAPLPQPDHPARACETALGMVEALRGLHPRWAAEGLPQLRARVGVNTGPMVVGNLGSERRFEYTVVGDSVNLAARLEQLNNVYGTDIIIGEATREAVADRFICRELDLVRVKGKTEQVRVYELLGRQGENGAWRERIALFEAALQAYRQGQWAEALALWEKLLALVPDDTPSQVFAERCRRLLREPPRSWDPCWDATAAT
ncbi:MAG: CHASE2 domain-containing protein, partial [Deltaproteobacteria bacterium]|nr:CHASE2 domain-containing protein [Deltaproteobacteria bacterium]